ncbi:hypothetical protein [Amycolatopsis saalfeldensis]|uniref:Uncharacterized protein n=1 Tax=Amycolatopsis saalfeldensis TaxID=394193 RepID=A0A1H8Y4P7_9PSEU|nr:hypothetical protein [Amycolatopsis saalfeldensis]SEP46518.1 hypothetical protein SAMN04489732_110275 [Amycolatopsis saalfeldensis]
MDNLADLAAQAAAAAGGYLAAIAGKVADKVKDGAAERLYGVIEPRLRGTASGTAALENLQEEPQAPERQRMVAAVLQDIAVADPGFAEQLAALLPAVASVSAQRWTGAHIQISDSRLRNSQVAARDINNSKHTLKIGTGGLVFAALALIALLVGAGAIGAQIGDSPCVQAAGPAQTDSAGGNVGRAPAGLPSGGSPATRNYDHLPTAAPYDTLLHFYYWIASSKRENRSAGDPYNACLLMSPQGESAFLRDVGFKDCNSAVEGIESQVTDHGAYNNFIGNVEEGICGDLAGDQSPEAQRLVAGLNVGDCIATGQYLKGSPELHQVTLDSCLFSVKGGPALGVFILTTIGKGWIITGHQPGPKQC